MTHLFVVAHPDDEVLGACGTILRLKQQGHRVVVCTFSESSKTREPDLKAKQQEMHALLGIDAAYSFSYETMQFAKYDRFDMTNAVEKIITEERAEVIYTHDANDIHNDHRLLNGIVVEAAKLPMRGFYDGPKIKAVYTMEVPSSTDWGSGFFPNAFVPVTINAIKLKAELIGKYDGVIRPVPHPRNLESFEALARYRGGQCGYEYAEAFIKIFEIA